MKKKEKQTNNQQKQNPKPTSREKLTKQNRNLWTSMTDNLKMQSGLIACGFQKWLSPGLESLVLVTDAALAPSAGSHLCS